MAILDNSICDWLSCILPLISWNGTILCGRALGNDASNEHIFQELVGGEIWHT